MRLNGLAKVHKKDTHHRPVLSTPGCSYENMNRSLSAFFQKLPGTDIETNRQDARKALESLSTEDCEQIVSLDVKSLYTNVPVGETIEIVLSELHSSNLAP